LWVDGVGWFAVDLAASAVVVPQHVEPVRREQRLWGVPVLLLRGGTGEVPLHAAAVDVDGQALVIVAPGRAGKTTLAAAFHAAGHRLLTEDLALVTSDGHPHVVPGPPTLRLRPDADARLSLQDVSVLRRDPDRTYLLLDEHRRGDGAPVPVAGIVFLHGGEGRSLTRVGATERLPELWSTSFSFEQDRAALFHRLASIAQSVPLWDLRRERTFESLPEVVGMLEGLCARA